MKQSATQKIRLRAKRLHANRLNPYQLPKPYHTHTTHTTHATHTCTACCFRLVFVEMLSIKFRTDVNLAVNRNLTFSQHVAENSSLLGCDAVSLGTCFPTFRKRALPSASKAPWSVTLEDESDRSLRNVFTFHIPQFLVCGMPLSHQWIMKVNFGFCRG
jgi:hypothetical protein